MDVKSFLTSYNTMERNLEGLGNTITIDTFGEYNTILTAPINKDVQIFA